MRNSIQRLLARLSVGKKLLLIYLLDLTAVIFISGILINEKYIAIDFARADGWGGQESVALRHPGRCRRRTTTEESEILMKFMRLMRNRLECR